MAMQIADRLESGKVHVNEPTVADEAYAPFGGVRNSGNGGRLGGPAANIEAFNQTQWVTVRPTIAPYPFSTPDAAATASSSSDARRWHGRQRTRT